MTKSQKTGIKEHAVIVITVMHDGSMYISSKNNGRSVASKMADAIVKMSAAVIEHPPLAATGTEGAAPATLPHDSAPAGTATTGEES